MATTVLAHGTGALNVDACRIPAGPDYASKCGSVVGLDSNRNGAAYGEWTGVRTDSTHAAGRWPTNLLLIHHPDCADGCVDACHVAEMDRQSGTLTSGVLAPHHNAKASTNASMSGPNQKGRIKHTFGGDSGGASRFFPCFRYEPKAPTDERPVVGGVAHPTVKPLDLMRWLVRLVTPPGGLVVDPFAGSGTTLEAAEAEGFAAFGLEREAAYLPLIRERLGRGRVRRRRPGPVVRPVREADGQGDLLSELLGSD